MKNFIKLLLLIFILLISGLIFYVGTKELSGNETMLLSIVISIVSILATVVTSHYYSIDSIEKTVEQINNENQSKLKTYAQKATEKVDNLSKELKKLSLYLQDELNQEYENTEEEIISREEKIKSAIYIAETLKAMNDNALSDWKGVIPQELEEREELEREKTEEVSNIIERFEEILSESQKGTGSKYIEEENDNIYTEIDDLKNKINILVKNLDGTQFPRTNKRKKDTKQEINNDCPSCKLQITYKQRPLANSVKNFRCKNCETELMGRWREDKGFYLEVPIPKDENVNCPNCGFSNTIKLSSKIFSNLSDVCLDCKIPYKVIRRINDIVVKPIGAQPLEKTYIKISDDLINIIKNELPAQPWPTGIHRIIADKQGVSPRVVSKIMNILIDRGEAQVQHKGKLYIEKVNQQ